MPQDNYTFEISLSVLNHLGRNLYRNFITILGEAISNAWDADAQNVSIYLAHDNSGFVIKDDGHGMTKDDFQGKFLKVGYSKRKTGGTHSPGKRPFIGAKGIGKLALLSCAEKVSVISKTEETDYTGGVIDNSELTKAIEQELLPDKYSLEQVDFDTFTPFVEGHRKGTIIRFEQTKQDIKSTIPHLKKLIALYFRFSLVDRSFKIFVNDKEVSFDDIKDLSDATEFLWNINDLEDPYIDTLKKLKSGAVAVSSPLKIKAFIASVEKPRYLKITGTEEKVGIDLFVNGRLRERDILKHLPDFSTRHIASYLYGQIHFDEMDGTDGDRFGTSREGVVPGDEKFRELLDELKNDILGPLSKKWDDLRLEANEDGDDDNLDKTIKARRARSLYNLSANRYTGAGDTKTDEWIKELRPDAEFNIPSYVECFISENLLRKHIVDKTLTPTGCKKPDMSGDTCLDKFDPKKLFSGACEYCKGKRGIDVFQGNKADAKISIEIRRDENNLLKYLDYIDLAQIVDDRILRNEDKTYKPLRNSVMHTSLLTLEAKTKLTSVFDNIVATIKKSLKIDNRDRTAYLHF